MKKEFEKLLEKLNNSQLQAVNHIWWPAMIVAWPGSGKTQVLALRTANLIKNAWIDGENILITTFTESWVVAIKERLTKFIWTEALKVNISTIHSLCQEIIKNFREKFDFKNESNAIDDVESYEILSEIIEKLYDEKKIVLLTTQSDRLFYLSDIRRWIWNLKSEWVNREKYAYLIEQEKKYYFELLEEKKQNKRIKNIDKYAREYEEKVWKMLELWIIFDAYNSYLREKSLYDFSDMINFVLEKFKVDEELRYYYAEKFQYIMIDEFQDTNNAQNQIVDLILSVNKDEQNILVVWDDDQSIYRFQWANIENMLDFSTKYKWVKFIVLDKNYRSTQSILDSARVLIENNNERLVSKVETLEKHLISAWEFIENNKPICYVATSEIDEKNNILEKIKLKKETVPLEEIAIIVRSNREVIEWSDFLQQNYLPVESKQKTNILLSHYIIFMLNYLEIIDNPYFNEEKLINILRSDFSQVEKIDVLTLNKYLYDKNYVRKDKIKIIDILKSDEELDKIYFVNKKLLINFRDNLLKLNSLLVKSSFINFFKEFIENIKILDYVEQNGTFDDLEDIYTLFNKIKKYSETNKNFWVKNLIRKMSLHNKFSIVIERQIVKTWESWIQVMTAHSSKWLEFNTVFIPGLYEWNWNNKRVMEKLKLPRWVVWEWLQFVDEKDEKIEKKDRQLEEDRRLFFVALTRAKKDLFLSYPRERDWKLMLISQFISEIETSIDFIESSERKEENIIQIIKNTLKPIPFVKYTNLELKYIEEFLVNYKLSPSDLNKFLEDPKVFLMQAVFKYPFVDNEATIFGKVYHRSLELFFTKFRDEKKLPDLSYVLFCFNSNLDREILSKDEKERLQERWTKWLTGYYETYKNYFLEPVTLEYNFRWKNVFFNKVPLTWKIDKIELINNEEWIINNFGKTTSLPIWWQLAFFKEKIWIVDYKTWGVKSIGEIKWLDKDWNKKPWLDKWKYWRQLLFYRLLCELDKEFNSKYDIYSMSLDFVEWKNDEYKKVDVIFSDEDYEEFKELVLETRDKISSINYWKEILEIK